MSNDEQVKDAEVNSKSVPLYEMIEFTISGTYRDGRGLMCDIHPLKVVVPTTDYDSGALHLRASRYLKKALQSQKKKNGNSIYPSAISETRQTLIDDHKIVKRHLSFVGKYIDELTREEIQDVATRKDLRHVPLPDSGYSYRETIDRLYVNYSNKILGTNFDLSKGGFSIKKAPRIKLDGEVRVQKKSAKVEVVEETW